MEKMTDKSLLDYPRVVVVEALNFDDKVAWLLPHALIGDRYTHPLPKDEGSKFGVDFETLIAKKGIDAALQVGDAFRTFNLHHNVLITQIIGEHVPDVEAL